MSSEQGQPFGQSPRQRTERTIDSADQLSTLLGALEDSDCRAVLEATSSEALSASELCEICDLSSSTAYRKIGELSDAGLLKESTRLGRSGAHISEYRLAASNVAINLQSGLELTMTDGQHTPTASD